MCWGGVARGVLGRRGGHLRPPRDAGDVLALADDVGLAQRQLVVAHRHVLHVGAVEYLRLQEDGRVLVPDRGEQQALGRVGVARVDHLQPGSMREEGLGRLRVVVPAVADRLCRRPDRQPTHVELAARAIAELGSLVADLVHRREYIVRELDLRAARWRR